MAQFQRENRNEQRGGLRGDENGGQMEGRWREREQWRDRDEEQQRFTRGREDWSSRDEGRFGGSEYNERYRSDPWQQGWQGSQFGSGQYGQGQYGQGQYGSQYSGQYGQGQLGGQYGQPYGQQYGQQGGQGQYGSQQGGQQLGGQMGGGSFREDFGRERYSGSGPGYTGYGQSGGEGVYGQGVFGQGLYGQGMYGQGTYGQYPTSTYGSQGFEQGRFGRERFGSQFGRGQEDEWSSQYRGGMGGGIGGMFEQGRERLREGIQSFREGRYRGRGPKGYTRSDERIREDVCDVLADHPMVDASEIEVQVKTGEVTLTGTVSSREEKRLAEDVIENLSGVKEVNNQLRIHREHQQGQQGETILGGKKTSALGSQSGNR
jgi:HSP20 family molecular chaperone IbpA